MADPVSYVTLTEFKDSLSNAGGAGSRTAAELPDGRLDAHLDDATSEVTGRLSGDWTLTASGPGDTAPLLKSIVVGIAGYAATLEFKGSMPLEDRDPVVLRFQRAQSMLERIAKGQLAVDGVTSNDGSTIGGEPAIYQGAPGVDLTREAPMPTYGGGYYGDGGWYGGSQWG